MTLLGKGKPRNEEKRSVGLEKCVPFHVAGSRASDHLLVNQTSNDGQRLLTTYLDGVEATLGNHRSD